MSIEDAFNDAEAAATAAVAKHPDATHIRRLTLAGRPVDLRVVGDALFEGLYPSLAPPGEHADASEPELSITLWDGAATGVDVPGGANGADPGLNGELDVSGDGRFIVHRRRTSTTWIDRRGRTIVGGFPSAADLSLFDRGKPLHLPLGVWHLDVGVPLVHAAVVAREGRGVLLPGRGGSGKSTAAISCALADFEYVGDDTVGLEMTDDAGVRAHAVYGSATVAPDHLSRFPTLANHALAGSRREEDKHLVLLSALLPSAPATTAMLSAVVLPRILPGARTRLRPASRGDALRALAPTTVLFFPGWGPKQLAFLGDVVARLPCYWLDMGPEVADIPPVIDELLSQ